jgi:hypothetical protein
MALLPCDNFASYGNRCFHNRLHYLNAEGSVLDAIRSLVERKIDLFGSGGKV